MLLIQAMSLLLSIWKPIPKNNMVTDQFQLDKCSELKYEQDHKPVLPHSFNLDGKKNPEETYILYRIRG
jgi:hypothetical protein